MLRRAARDAREAFNEGVRLEIAGLVATALLLLWAAIGWKGAVVAGLAGITILSLTIGYFFRRYEYLTSRRRKKKEKEWAEEDEKAPPAPAQEELREVLDAGLERLRKDLLAVIEKTLKRN